MALTIEELKRRVKEASKKLAEFTRTPKRLAQAKKWQAKGAQASIGRKCSERKKEAIRQGQARRRARERAEKAKEGST